MPDRIEVRPPVLQDGVDRHDHAVGRRALDGVAPLGHLAQPQRVVQRQRMRDAGLVGLGRHDHDVVAEAPGDALQHGEPRRVDAVVVGDEDPHRSLPLQPGLRRPDPLEAAHVGPQHLRHRDGAVRVLVVLQHGDERAAHRHARAVQRVDEAGRLRAGGPVAGLHAARLEVAAGRAGRDLAERPLPRQPDFEVVGLARREAHVARAEQHAAVVQAQPLQHGLGGARHALVLGVRCSGVVTDTISTLANWCWRIMPRVSRPAEPASARKQLRQRREAQRQLALVDHPLAREVGQRHLGGGDQPVVVAGAELVVAELRQLRRAEHGGVAHQHRRVDLLVAVPVDVQVDHVLAERAVQPRQRALEHHEARAGHLRRGVEVHQPERLAEREVLARHEAVREARLLPGAVLLDVAALVGAERHVRRAAGWGSPSGRRRGRGRRRAPRPPAPAPRPSGPPPRPSGARRSPASLRPIAWPISLAAALRRSCTAWSARSRRGGDRRATAARPPAAPARAPGGPRRRRRDCRGST